MEDYDEIDSSDFKMEEIYQSLMRQVNQEYYNSLIEHWIPNSTN